MVRKEKNHPLQPRDLSIVTEDGVLIVAKGKCKLSVDGGEPHTSVLLLT
jgi:hypothetical protein